MIYLLTPPANLQPHEYGQLKHLHEHGAMAAHLRMGLYDVELVCLAKTARDVVVGWSMLTKSKEVHVYVSLDFRRRGIGSELVRKVCEEAQQEHEIFAYPSDFLKGGSFYMKLGFRSTMSENEMALRVREKEKEKEYA